MKLVNYKREWVRIEVFGADILSILKNQFELILSAIAVIISLSSAWYTHIKNKDYVDIIISEPVYLIDSVHLYNEDRKTHKSDYKSALYTRINIINASNHNIGFFDFNLYDGNKLLYWLEPSVRSGTQYLFTQSDDNITEIISDKAIGGTGTIQARSSETLLIAASDENTLDIRPIDNVTLKIKIIKPNFWSFIPFLSTKLPRYVEFEHTFTAPYISLDPPTQSLDSPIIERI